MKRCIYGILFILLSISFPAYSTSAASGSGVEILRTGTFYDIDTVIDAKNGEKWFGLYSSDTGMYLEETKITVESVHEDFDIESGGPIDGVKVSVKQKNDPVFLIRGISGMKDGPVKTCFSGDRSLKPGTFDLSGCGNCSKCRLVITGNVGENDNYENYRLTLESSDVSQEICNFERCYETNPYIYWAGDLDGDGALDIYMDISNNYLYSQLILFLSSTANGGDILGKAAEFIVNYP